MQRFIPYLSYDDAKAAIDFLTEAFGFEERSRYPMDDGRIGHCEMALGGAALYLASAYPEMGFNGPGAFDGVHSQVYVQVDDVDGHHARARDAGATIAAPPVEEHGTRMYRAVDLEGRRWIFASPTPPEAE